MVRELNAVQDGHVGILYKLHIGTHKILIMVDGQLTMYDN